MAGVAGRLGASADSASIQPAMKTHPMVLALLLTGAARGDSGVNVGFGHFETAQFTLLARTSPAAPLAPLAARPRPLSIAPRWWPSGADSTDLIAKPRDQQKVLRSLHIDPKPTPPSGADRRAGSTGPNHGDASPVR